MKFDIQTIATIINANAQGNFESETIEYFSIDTRNLPFAHKALFFALIGYKKDGHDFIPEAYRLGARAFVVRNDYLPPIELENTVLFRVTDPLIALQTLATHYRKSLPETTFVGITGSNGKTIVKEWLASLIPMEIPVGRSPGSYNSQIGVPLSILTIQATDKIALIEAGISRAGEMDILSQIIQPDIGIFTGIGSAHDEGFKDEEEKIHEKIKLFSSCHTIIYPRDNIGIHAALKQVYPDKKMISWGKNESSDLKILHIDTDHSATTIKTRLGGKEIAFTIKALDTASIENAMSCLAFLHCEDYINETTLSKFSQLEALKNRLELKNGILNSLLLNDSYSADLSGFRVAFNFLKLDATERKKILILSDFALQKDEKFREKTKEAIAAIINDQPVELLITIGEYLSDISSYLDNIPHENFENVSRFLREFDRKVIRDSIILVKGSRTYALEEIVNEFSIKQHQTLLEIDLAAIRQNLNFLASRLSNETKIMVMVKAAAYGAGSVEVASWLQNQRIDYLGVAYADEGVELRENGIKLPIMVLNTEVQAFENLVKYQLEPEIFSLTQLQTLLDFLKNRRLNNFPIHLKIETGMNRLGFRKDDFQSLFNLIKANESYIRIASIFSHLSSTDLPGEDHFTVQQVEDFMSFVTAFKEEMGYQPMRHILNSTGILRFPEYEMEMVRVGIGMYGLIPDHQNSPTLIHALTFKSVISQIKTIQAGESVSYGRTWKADKPTRVATIGLGYADGLRRDAGKRDVFLYIHGKSAPIIGSICMDMCIVDVTAIPEAREGDEAVVFSHEFPISILAEKLETIPYEVLTSISKRVQRVYINS